MSMLDELYQEIILDHYKSPRNCGRLEDPDIAHRGYNPLCGDEVELSLIVRDNRVADVRYQGRGCSISQASASMMTEAIKGKSLDEVKEVIDQFKGVMLDRNAEPVEGTELGDLEALQGVKKYPVRIKCALLSWNTLSEGLALLSKATQAAQG